jgi:hypothetical protein
MTASGSRAHLYVLYSHGKITCDILNRFAFSHSNATPQGVTYAGLPNLQNERKRTTELENRLSKTM